MPKIRDGFNGERSIMLPKTVADSLELDPLTNMLYITWIGYYPKAKYHHRKREEPIDQNIMIYCVDGAGWYRVRGKQYNIKANQFFVLPAGEEHEYGADIDSPWTIYWIHFRGSLVKCITGDNCEPRKIEPSPSSRITDRIAMFEELYNLMGRGYSISNFHYISALFHLFVSSLYHVEQFRLTKNVEAENKTIVESVEHYMLENVEKRLTLSQLTSYSGYSQSRFTSIFKKATGYTPLFYFNMLKIRYACSLMDNIQLSITQISYKVGIEDSLYFSRLFKKIMGVSPSKYRTMQKT